MRKNKPKTIAGISRIIAGVVLLLMIVLCLALQTGLAGAGAASRAFALSSTEDQPQEEREGFFSFGKRLRGKVASELSDFLSTQLQQQVELEGLEGLSPFDVRLKRIRVSDTEGVWLTADNVVLRWSPGALVKKQFQLDEISASTVRLSRLPVGQPKEEPPKTEASKPSDWMQTISRVRLDKLSLGAVELGEPILGQSAVLGVEGSLRGVEPSGAEAALHVERKDAGPRTSLQATVTPHGAQPDLKADVHFEEEPNGLVASLAGLKDMGSLRVNLEGDGPLQEWQGKLQSAVEKLGVVRTDIRLKADEEITLVLDGGYEPAAGLVPSSWALLAGGENRFASVVHLVLGRYADLQDTRIWGLGYSGFAQGRVDFETRAVGGDLALQVDDLGVVEPLVGQPLQGGLSLRGAVAGTMDQPKAELFTRLCRVRTETLQVENAQVNLQVNPLPRSKDLPQSFWVLGNGEMSGLATSDGKPLPERSFQWNANLDAQTDGDLLIHEAAILGEHHEVQLAGRFNPAELAGNLGAVIEAKDLRSWAALTGKELSGSALSQIQVVGEGKTRSVYAHIQGETRELKGLAIPEASLLGPQLIFSADANLNEGKTLTVSALRLKSEAFELTNEAWVHLTEKRLRSSWQLSAPNLTHFSAIVGKPLTGSLTAEGAINGPFDALENSASLQGKNVTVNGTKFQQVAADLTARGLPDAPQGKFQLSVVQGKDKLEAMTQFALQDQRLKLSPITMQAPGSRIKGDVAVDLKSNRAEGSLDGQFRDLAMLGRFLGESMAGNGDFQVKLTPTKAGQNASLQLKGKGLKTPFGAASAVTLSANAANVLEAPQGTLTLNVQTFERPGLTLQSLGIKATGDAKKIAFEGSTKGRATEDFDVRTQGAVLLGKTGQQFRMELLNGSLGEYRFRLLQPLTAQRAGEGVQLETLALGFGEGRIQASGRMDARQVQLNGEFQKLPVEVIASFGGPDVTARAAGSLKMEGPVTQPAVNLTMEVTDIRARALEATRVPPTSLTAQTRLANGRLSLNTEIRGPFEQPVQARFELPARFSVSPFLFSLPPQGAIQGQIEGQADLATLASLVPQEDHKLSGKATASFRVQGTLANPEISGSTTIDNGSYQNLEYGTILRDMQLRLVAVGRRLEIERLSATDGEGGSITGEGWVNLSGTEGFPLDLEVNLSNASLVRRDDVTGKVGGNVQLTGSTTNMKVAGKLEVGPAEVNLLRTRSAASITSLDVIEVNSEAQENLDLNERSKSPPSAAPPKPAASESTVALDVRVSIPGRVFVRGQGLTSEWEGNLHISGTASNPIIRGTLTSVRGHYDFLDRRFTLVESHLNFYGDTPPIPRLDITTEATANDITARLLITGVATDPKIELQSTPPLPSDEILSRLLFSRSMDKITPMQALKLARAAQALSGKGGNAGFMDRTRKFLGVEQLELRDAEGEDGENGGNIPALGIGKYLSDDVYVDFEKGLGSEPGKATVEVEITPHISLEGKVSLEADTGLGVKWKHDY